jgi:hypothetical protein
MLGEFFLKEQEEDEYSCYQHRSKKQDKATLRTGGAWSSTDAFLNEMRGTDRAIREYRFRHGSMLLSVDGKPPTSRGVTIFMAKKREGFSPTP